MAKYHENLLKDSTLALPFMVKFFSSLETMMILKMPNETFLRITRYDDWSSVEFLRQKLRPRKRDLKKLSYSFLNFFGCHGST